MSPWVAHFTKTLNITGKIAPLNIPHRLWSLKTAPSSANYTDLLAKSTHSITQSIKDLAKNLEVIAYDPRDKVIEAVTSTDGSPFLGVQWHPEYLFPTRPGDLACLIMWFTNFRLNPFFHDSYNNY